MIIVDSNQCKSCGACVEICSEKCIDLSSGAPLIDRAQCSTCGQCIARCPARALSWDGVQPTPFDPASLPSQRQLEELFKQRRSIRYFTGKPIPREVLVQIAESGAYAPTHNFHFRLVIVDDPQLLAELERILVVTVRLIYLFLFQPRLVGWLAGVFGYAEEYQLSRPKLEWSVKNQRAFYDLPAAIIIIAGDRKIPLSEASAQYFLANMQYTAQLLGVGACLWGNAQLFIDKNRPARRKLGLSAGERIYGALYLGYPAVKFINKIEGKSLPIQWNGG